MKYIVAIILIALAMICFEMKNDAKASAGDRTPAVLATYSSAKTSVCVRGSIAHSKTRMFVCYSTGLWKKATIQ